MFHDKTDEQVLGAWNLHYSRRWLLTDDHLCLLMRRGRWLVLLVRYNHLKFKIRFIICFLKGIDEISVLLTHLLWLYTLNPQIVKDRSARISNVKWFNCLAPKLRSNTTLGELLLTMTRWVHESDAMIVGPFISSWNESTNIWHVKQVNEGICWRTYLQWTFRRGWQRHLNNQIGSDLLLLSLWESEGKHRL
jgi:hypothetical protein